MPDEPYPTLDEFWERLDKRKTERDLRDELRRRTDRESGVVARVGPPETVVAVVDRILPGTAVPPEALAAFVDEMFDRQHGRGDERLGVLARDQLIPRGFETLDREAGGSFAGLAVEQQDALLSRAERGDLHGGDGFSSSQWFSRLRDLVLLAFGSDPRGMVHMGFPGPSYQPGYVWLGSGEVAKRADRAPGHERL